MPSEDNAAKSLGFLKSDPKKVSCGHNFTLACTSASINVIEDDEEQMVQSKEVQIKPNFG